MDKNQIRLELHEFRAIKEADIILNGITVVAGENGCGKSTISKFLYYIFKHTNEYNLLVDHELRDNLRKYYYFLSDFQEEVYKSSLKNSLDPSKAGIEENRRTIYRFKRSYLEKSNWDNIDALYAEFKPFISNDHDVRIKRLERILKDVLDDRSVDDAGFEQLIEALKKKIALLFESASDKKRNRPSALLIKKLSELLGGLPSIYKITEYDSLIIGNDEDTLIKAYSVQQAVYIDTPMLLGIEDSKNGYWDDINRILYHESKEGSFNAQINKMISDDVLNGEIFLEEEPMHAGMMDVFTYRREDGSEFNLLECATGLKSFAMLQMLLKNGYLNKYTLLIIDEPESHLHPQWIIEYARLIVLLNKHVGVKFFIASHNPDMVSAIKYISEKEKVDNNLNFYIAERNRPFYLYTYKHLGTDIEPIFESFNIALDRMSRYGVTEENEDEVL